MYSNYIFDLYGTLVNINTNEEFSFLWEKLRLFYSFNRAIYTRDELKSKYFTLVNKKLDSNLCASYPDFDIEEVFKELYIYKNIYPSKDLIKDTAHFFRILSIEKLELYEGVANLLDKLKNKNKRIFLLTNAQKIFTSYELELLGIKKYFDGILYSSDYKVSKPSKEFYNILLNKYNLIVKETIMIGNDYFCDITPAKNLKLDTLYIHSNISPQLNYEVNSTYKILDGNVEKINELIIK